MQIEKLECKNFRNYQDLAVSFSPGTNILFGDNAQGKTNLLEAIRLCGTTRSHRGARDAEMIRFGENEAHLRLYIQKSGAGRRIDFHLRRNTPKGVAIDGVPIRRAAELMGTVHTVLFSPEDLAIIKRGPKERRHFLDGELCQLSGAYFQALSAYNRVVAQRNQLLKELPGRPSLEETLDVWDAQLLSHAEPLIQERTAFVAELNTLVGDLHARLTGGREKLELAYEPSASLSAFPQKLAEARSRDKAARTTTLGPHRDDLRVQANDIDLRRYGSQGQQRSAALALKLAEIELVRQRTGEQPVLLLDDVLSELDATRQTLLLSNIAGTQTFLTCTGVEGLLADQFPAASRYHVRAGQITGNA